MDTKLLDSLKSLIKGDTNDAEKKFLTGRDIRSDEIEGAAKIFLEFIQGFDKLDLKPPCVTVFGSARFHEGHPYYELTRKSRNIFSNEAPVNVLIVIGVSFLALIGVMYSFLSLLGSRAVSVASNSGGNLFIEATEKVVGGAGIAEEAARDSAVPVAENIVQGSIAETAANVATTSGVSIEAQLVILVVALAAVSIILGFYIARAKH